MPGILDIAPPELVTETIEIRGQEITVRGMRNREWVGLMRRFVVLRKQAAGIAIDEEEMAQASIEMQPAVVAAGMVRAGVEAETPLAEIEAAVARNLTDAEIAQLFNAIMRLTNPSDPLAGSPAAAPMSGVDRAETI